MNIFPHNQMHDHIVKQHKIIIYVLYFFTGLNHRSYIFDNQFVFFFFFSKTERHFNFLIGMFQAPR